METGIDREKVIARMAARMDKRDLEEAALLQRARDGRLDLGIEDEFDAAAEVELPILTPSCRSAGSRREADPQADRTDHRRGTRAARRDAARAA
jgi:hypothetical protein